MWQETNYLHQVGRISEAHPAVTLSDPAVSPDALRLSGLQLLILSDFEARFDRYPPFF
jgi:hypothetical protein